MKFEDEIRFLKSMGLAAVMPDGELHPISRKLRHPRGYIPVRVVERRALPRQLVEMIRRSRAEIRNSHRSRRND